jgi:hypothetical protein
VTNLASTYEQPIMVSMWRWCRGRICGVWIILSLYSLSSNAHSHWSQILIHSKPILMICSKVKIAWVIWVNMKKHIFYFIIKRISSEHTVFLNPKTFFFLQSPWSKHSLSLRFLLWGRIEKNSNWEGRTMSCEWTTAEWNPQGKRGRGRPLNTWKDGIRDSVTRRNIHGKSINSVIELKTTIFEIKYIYNCNYCFLYILTILYRQDAQNLQRS